MSRKKTTVITDHMDYAWRYFQLHANQRIAIFNFYIFICSLLVTGYLTVLKESRIPASGAVLGTLLILFSFIFWKLDVRVKGLIWNSEEALKFLEKESVPTGSSKEPHVLNIFEREEFITKALKKRDVSCLNKRYYSYSDCFNLVYFSFASLGLLGALYSLLSI